MLTFIVGIVNGRLGSSAAPFANITLMSSCGSKPGIKFDQSGFASAPSATAWNAPGDNIGGRACSVFSFIVLAPVSKRFGKLRLAGASGMSGRQGYFEKVLFLLLRPIFDVVFCIYIYYLNIYDFYDFYDLPSVYAASSLPVSLT